VPEGAQWGRTQAKLSATRALGGALQPPALPTPLQLSDERKASVAAARAARDAARAARAAEAPAAEASAPAAEVEAAAAEVEAAAEVADISMYLGEGATDYFEDAQGWPRAGPTDPAVGWPELVSPQPAREVATEEAMPPWKAELKARRKAKQAAEAGGAPPPEAAAQPPPVPMSSYLGGGDDSIERAPTAPSPDPVGPTHYDV
jgi:hypothetical protein